MQPRTFAALAVTAGLVLGTGVLAIGATLMPSSASPRHYEPAADIASDPGTTIVTDVQTVYDPAPAPANHDGAAPASPVATDHSSTTSSAVAPAATTAPTSRETESPDDAREPSSSSSAFEPADD